MIKDRVVHVITCMNRLSSHEININKFKSVPSQHPYENVWKEVTLWRTIITS